MAHQKLGSYAKPSILPTGVDSQIGIEKDLLLELTNVLDHISPVPCRDTAHFIERAAVGPGPLHGLHAPG